ncbi:MAG: GNAT family N-acetyltransferase [Chloroflexota bacterium]
MDTNYHLRSVTAWDAMALHKTCWPDKSVEAVQELLDRAEGLIRRKRGLGIITEIEGHIVGYAQLTLWSRTGEISDLIVAPGWRDRGIGSAMICYLVEKARDWPMPQVEIGVAMTNPRAYALYRRLGFQESRIVNLDLGSGPEAVMYLTMQFDAPL